MTDTRQDVIEELEAALSGRTFGYRVDALRRITDLFLSGPGYSEQEISVFDGVMGQLAEQMETSVRSALASRLAANPNAPPNLIRRLAGDAAIEVAGPVLRASDRLDDAALIESARTSSQDHLLAISQRATISENVTDVLIDRGSREVALTTVRNAGARFSDAGREALVERSQDDGELAVGVLSRPDIPHQCLLKLFAVASDKVRRKLEAADPSKIQLIRAVMADVSNDLQGRMREGSRDYVDAEQTVVDLQRDGKLDEPKIRMFARMGKFDETTVAMSVLCDLPISACERAMVQDRSELVLLLAKAIGLSWTTTKAILFLRAGPRGCPPAEIDANLVSFSKLREQTARKALQFMRLRDRATAVTK